MHEVDLIDARELKEKLDRGDGLKVVMTLGEWEYRTTHIPGSIRVSTVEDYLIFGVEHFERFLYSADAYRTGDMGSAVFPLAQGHDDLQAVSPVELLFQLPGVDEIHLVHSANSSPRSYGQDSPTQGSKALGPTSPYLWPRATLRLLVPEQEGGTDGLARAIAA